jgi:uncharacterized protein (DUF427 family)
MSERESVWDYPRPPRVEACRRRARVLHRGVLVAESARAVRVLETSHPPGIYLPRDDVSPGVLVPSPTATFCEFKGRASYWNLSVADDTVTDAAWSYEDPSPGYERIAGYISFYPGRVDACFLDDEAVVAQSGDFYGGWITADIEGPFKGGPGTTGG